MDMEEILTSLYALAVEPDPERIRAFSRSVKKAGPYYDRLCDAVGATEGEVIWNAALDVGASSEQPIFRAGLCLGMRLMALCL